MIKRVCIIGAGPSGLTAIKTCLEEKVTPVCYEKTNNYGGLWRYRNEDEEGVASVMKSTIINSSKEINAFSDFPPAPEMANFMHNTCVLKYLDDYVNAFNLNSYIQYNHTIVGVKYASDYELTGKWIVQVKDQEVKEEIFDAVLICIGHHVYPQMPNFLGLDDFQGTKIHSHSYKVPNGYEDKNVLVVGIGNSGGDVAVDTSRIARQVYLSTRRGTWVMNMVGQNGYPADLSLVTRFMFLLKNYLPWSITNAVMEANINNRFDHKLYGLRPKHRLFEQHLMFNDDMPNRIASGKLTIKPDVDHFTRNGVVFKGDDTEYPIDSVILATGYKIAFPFLPDDILPPAKDNDVTLYKYMYPPNLKHPTLSIIGLTQPIGSILPVSEMQCRVAIRVLLGKCNLPSRTVMKRDIEERREYLKKYAINSPRHTLEVDYITYTDSIAEMIGAKPNLLKIFFTDPRLFLIMFFGPCYPYQYRLNGPHSWPGATNAILTGRNRVEAPLMVNRSNLLDIEEPFLIFRLFIAIIFFGQIFITLFGPAFF